LDDQELAICSNYKNVLTGKRTSLRHISASRKYQSIINIQGFAVDTESSYWLQIVLEKSTESSLLIRVKQRLNSFDKSDIVEA
jgi:hypothetical protein